MFNGDNNESKGLIPENTPESSMEAGEIGITNMSRKNLGLIGIRTADSSDFGPTGEPFSATNVVGKVVDNITALDKLKDGSTLYIYEVYELEGIIFNALIFIPSAVVSIFALVLSS